MADREQFLARVAAALRHGAPQGRAPAPVASASWPVPRRSTASTVQEVLLQLFAARLCEVGGTAAVVADRDAAYAVIAELLRARGATVACAGALKRPAIDPLWVDDCRRADFGLSAADWGIAETGTVVLRHHGEHGRAFSLVPPAVGFLLPASRLVPHLGVVLAALHEDAAGPPACVTFVSGASHSADIAGVRCVGVHGPAEVYVWVVADE